MRVKLRSINVAPKARSSKAQGGRARDSGLWNPGSGIEERSALKGRHRFLPHKTCAALSGLIETHDPFPGLASWALLCRAFGTKPRLDPAPPSWELPDTTRSAGGVFIVLGDPPALPGRQHKFDRSGRPSRFSGLKVSRSLEKNQRSVSASGSQSGIAIGF
jgi:hypothetical protein